MKLSIVCYLDDSTAADVRNLQRDLHVATGALASLKMWLPHITVGDGIEVNDSGLAIIQDKFKTLSATTKSFDLTLQNILKIDSRKGGREEETTPYGLYLGVEPNKQLICLVDDIATITRSMKKWYSMPRPYHPHCTLAYKDLDKKGFVIGGKHLDRLNLRYSSRVNHVALVEALPKATRELIRFHFTQ